MTHLSTQIIGSVLALLAVRWCAAEMPRDWRNKRVPLILGPHDWRLLLPVLGSFAALVPVLWAIVAFELIPRDATGGILFMILWLFGGFISALLAMNARQIRRGARGWITVRDDNILQVETAEGSTTFQLHPGSVRFDYIDGPPGHIQFTFQQGPQQAHVWGILAMRHLKLVRKGPAVPGQGLMIGSSIKPLVEWLRPFVATTP